MPQSTPPPILITRALLLLLASALALPGQNSSYRPGTTDPAGNPGNFTLFRDQQVFVMSPGTKADPWPTDVVSFNASMAPSAAVSNLPWSSAIPFDQVDIQAVGGRIVHPDKDDIAVIQRSETDGTKLAVRFRDGSGETLLGNLPPRAAGWADLFATSEGDLDRLYDSKGNYHDEVIAAWMEKEANAYDNSCGSLIVPHVAVLNYGGGTNNPFVLEAEIPRAHGQYMTTCALDGYNYFVRQGSVPTAVPQPIDNIVATAIGDFDGDGYHELAVAYMGLAPPNVVISVVIFRYRNDGTAAWLTPVNTIDIPSAPNQSMVGTLSLAAGDFDGSGVDQLLVGSAYWSGTPGGNGYKGGTLQTRPVFFLIKGGQVLSSVIAAASTGTDNASTEFSVSLGSGVYVPRTVSISGATGKWAVINGTWPVTLTDDGFSIAVDSSQFGGFDGQAVRFTAAAQITQSDSMEVDAFPGLPGYSPGPIHIDDTDTDGRIRVQMVPGLFHFDPSKGFGYQRRQVAVAWNARPAPSQNLEAAKDGDSHLGIIQVTNDDKITFAIQQNGLLGGFQTFQNLSLAAGAFRGDHDTNNPTWSLFLSGVGESFNLKYPDLAIAEGTVNTVLKVTPDSTDSNKLQLANVWNAKASGDTGSPFYYGFAPPPTIYQIWGADARMDSPSGAYPFPANNYLRLPAIAVDLNGNSLRLGAPVHFEITNPGKADFILEQPPQHAAWLDLGSGAQVVTINRYPTFNTSMEDSEKRDFAAKDTNHLDWTVGGSVTGTASQSVSVGAKGQVLGADFEATEKTKQSVSAKVAYDYDSVSSNYDSNYASYTAGRGAATGEDDSLIVEAQILDLWRYRIYGNGTDTGNPKNPNAFYEIVLPGPSLLSNPGGRDVDWYQPVHEVGNILSYPERAEVCSPSDLGPITIPNTTISNQVIPLINCSQQFYNGNSSSLSLALDHQTGGGSSADYTHKLHTDVDFSYTSTTKLSAGGTGSTTKLGLDVDLHGGADWGTLTTSDNSTTDATGITVNSPQGDSQYAYPYYPIFYNTTAGGLKVAYAVGDLTASYAGGEFWIDNYGSKPDPALNLPNRFQATYSHNGILNGWEPVTTIVRKRMKGFVVRQPAIDPAAGIYPLLGSNPQDGDTVMLEARVYNYSISSIPTGPITVRFSVIPYDGETDNEICQGIPSNGKGGRVCPASARIIIGTGSSAPTGGVPTISLNARQNTEAYLMWNTKGFGPKSAGVNEYRVYVDLISNANGPGELYPPEPPCTAVPCEDDYSNERNIDPGQNNEGWSLLSVAAPKPNLLGASETDAISDVTRETLNAESPVPSSPQTAYTASGTAATPATAYLHRPLRMRITDFSNAVSTLFGNVTISDGRPGAANTKTIAVKTLLGARPHGSSAWFDWTPLTIGPHHLYAVTQNTEGAKPLGDLIVQVRRAPGDLNGDGRVDTHDLNILQRSIGKAAAEGACGVECDLDGDGSITQKDAALMSQLCDSPDCAFAKIEYVGGSSAFEPDIRSVRAADEAATAAFLAANSADTEMLSSAPAQPSLSQLYQAELNRKLGVRSIQYYYKGKPVMAGLFAPRPVATAKTVSPATK